MRLHLFYPENDLALATGKASYTPPPKVLGLRRAGATLPLWYGDPGDLVCATGVDARWYDRIMADFEPGTELFDHNYRPGMQPAPWGWSAASAALLRQQGVPQEALPTAEALDRIRLLSHRRTAATVQGLVAAQLPFPIADAAVECTAVDAIPLLLKAGRQFIAKLPWSSSGRGLLDSRKCSPEHFIRQAEGMIHSQGSFMLETAYERVADFAMLFDCEATGSCRFAGYSLFDTTPSGQYTSNLLLPDSEIESRLAQYVPREQLHAIQQALASALAEVCRDVYSGPAGVDMLIADTPRGFLVDATVEINFRMTMGRVAHTLAERYVMPGAEARFKVVSGSASDATPVVDARRLSGGCLLLNPPSPHFNFVIQIG
ncbi:MAG: hypothetical protein K2F74_04405 [Muribaculaceae bacterium]|nr:hypothetical protein [Muribaculaceae bacterium]